MGRKKVPGLINRGGIWHVDKRLKGRRVCFSTGTARLEEAEEVLARLIEEHRQASIFGVRPDRTFEEAAAKYVLSQQHKRSLDKDITTFKQLMHWIGDLPLSRVHMGTLQPWIDHRLKEGKSARTVNHGPQLVRRVLNLAASEWIDEHGLTWLAHAPKITLLAQEGQRKPYPLSWDEQDRLFANLPKVLGEMALFTVNTGCRDQEVCNLRWDWEVKIPALDTSVFIIPEWQVKNGEERLVVLNRVAASVIEARRGIDPTYVFTYRGKPYKKMLSTGWRTAREKAGLLQVRVHDLKHTFGRRLRAAGVSFEDRQDLLGHRSGRITTHYSAAELSMLIKAADKVCDRGGRRPELVVLRRINFG